MDVERERKRISAVLAEWVRQGVLVVVEKEDDQRRPRMFVEVGKWVTE
jgi:hypothetical protein